MGESKYHDTAISELAIPVDGYETIERVAHRISWNDAIDAAAKVHASEVEGLRMMLSQAQRWCLDAQGERDEYRKAMMTARPFVRREQNHGKHEQDRADATDWLEKHGEVG